MVTESGPEPAGSAGAPAVAGSAPHRPSSDGPASTAPASTDGRATEVARPARNAAIATFDVPATLRPIAAPDGWTDVQTGTDGPRLWDRVISGEQARVARYRRPVTVAFAEIAGIERVADRWGWDVAGRALATCARQLGREIRTSDHLARLAQTRFGILLTETAEIEAINFIERARASCERELVAVAGEISLGFGWASTPAGGTLSDAIDTALRRLAAELAPARERQDDR